MKSHQDGEIDDIVSSLPVWGEWIEIRTCGRSNTGESCLSPCGESGLKLVNGIIYERRMGSLPVWGEWIEIFTARRRSQTPPSLPVWGEWIEILPNRGRGRRSSSLPVWGEWIEIGAAATKIYCLCLSPCGESGLKFSFIVNVSNSLGVSPRVGRVD